MTLTRGSWRCFKEREVGGNWSLMLQSNIKRVCLWKKQARSFMKNARSKIEAIRKSLLSLYFPIFFSNRKIKIKIKKLSWKKKRERYGHIKIKKQKHLIKKIVNCLAGLHSLQLEKAVSSHHHVHCKDLNHSHTHTHTHTHTHIYIWTSNKIQTVHKLRLIPVPI